MVALPPWTLQTVISGGQTGADQAGVAAARFLNYQTGGRAPKDFMTEEGPAPWLAEFGLQAGPVASLKSRTYHNVTHADATIIFTKGVLEAALRFQTRAAKKAEAQRRRDQLAGNLTPAALFQSYGLEGGSLYTAELCVAHRKSLLIDPVADDDVRNFLFHCQPVVVNIAGSRESKAPGIFTWVYGYLIDALIPF